MPSQFPLMEIDNISSPALGDISYRRQIRKQIKKLAAQKARLVFLLKCRRHSLTPRFILDQIHHLMGKYEHNIQHVQQLAKKMIDTLQQSLLNMEISICCFEIDRLETSVSTGEMSLTQSSLSHDTLSIQVDNQQFYQQQLRQHNANLHRKFTNLIAQQDHLNDIKFDERFIKNLTDITIPNEVMITLSLGPKFAVTPETLPIIDLATDVEHTIARHIQKENQREARGNAFYALTKHSRKNTKLNRIDKFLQKGFGATKSFLKQHPELMVSNSDKGGVTIISLKEDYHSKMMQLVDDRQAFDELERDPTTTVRNKINNQIDSLFQRNIISVATKKRLKCFNAIPPRLFGQIKYHKEGLPIRPIVSTINSAGYKTARFLATILKQAFPNPKFNIKNSQQFVKTMRRRNITEGNVLVSFDVVNCFGSIPVSLALNTIERDFEYIEQVTPIPKEDFLALLKTCLEQANYFVFNDRFYKQKLGMFMGSSLAPILVERVIEDVVNKALLELQINPDFWVTYVDDHLTSIPMEIVDTLLDTLNSYNPNVQFTVEIQNEDTRSINFLDLTVHNCGTKMKMNWFSKAIASNRLLNFYSKHPPNMVRNIAKSFIRRVLTVSHVSFHQENLTKIRTILERNNFPTKVIDDLIHQVKQTRQVLSNTYPYLNNTTIPTNATSEMAPTANSTMITQQTVYCGMTYIPSITESMTGHLKRNIPGLVVAPRPPGKIAALFSDMKHKIPVDDKSNVVYKIPCGGCNKCYIGETTQLLKNRSKQHKNDVVNRNKNPHKTALVKHVSDTDHQFEFDSKTILKNERTQGKLKLHEINQIILHDELACNFKTDAIHVSPVFYNLIKSNGQKINNNISPSVNQVSTISGHE